MTTRVGGDIRLLTTGEVARMLRVNPRTVNNWIKQDRIPYLELPGGEYRVPLAGLLSSLGGTFDLGKAIRELDEATAGISEEEIAAALDE
jgi:excisionase family DNA binding protein